MSEDTPTAPPQWSPDGHWWWTGQDWVPAAAVTPVPAAELVPSSALVPELAAVAPVVVEPAAAELVAAEPIAALADVPATTASVLAEFADASYPTSSAAETSPVLAASPVATLERPAQGESEGVLLEGQRHWLFYLGPACVAGALSLLALIVAVMSSFVLIVGAVVLAAGAFGLYVVGNRAREATRIFVTSRRVGFTVGIMEKRSFEMLLSKVESIASTTDLLGRLFGYSNLVIVGTGGTREVLQGIIDGEQFRAVVQDAAHNAQGGGPQD